MVQTEHLISSWVAHNHPDTFKEKTLNITAVEGCNASIVSKLSPSAGQTLNCRHHVTIKVLRKLSLF